MKHTEPITLQVTQRPGCGTAIFRCNGKVASCTGNEEGGVERCAAKALAVLADLHQDKSILNRKPVIQLVAGDLSAKLDGNGNNRAGQWLMVWRNKGWVETGAPGQFKKTESFGK